MWTKIKALKEERGQILADMKAMLTKSQDEKRELTPEESAKFDEMNTKAEARKAEIARYESAKALETDLGSQRADQSQIGRGNVGNATQTPSDQEQRELFNEFCRSGEIRVTNTITTTTGSGAYVPKTVAGIQSIAKLANSLKAARSFYGIPSIPVSGKVVVSVPVVDLTDGDTLAGAADGESLSTNTDSSVSLTVATYNSKAQWLDNGIVTAQTYDAAGSLVPVLQVACERGQEAAFYTASINTAGLKAAARETAGSGVVAFGDLSGMLFDLGAYALGRTAYLVSMSVLSSMHSMVDDNGYPINKLTKDGSGQYFWDGVPVFPTSCLEVIGAGKYSAAAINVDACATAESNQWVQRYDQAPARPNQTGFDLLQYAAFGIKAGAVKLLKIKA